MRHDNSYQKLVFICFFGVFLGGVAFRADAANPIVEGVGLCDPQVRVYDNHVYLYATHDAVPGSTRFIMNDWWVWTTDDLINWQQVSTLKPVQTYYKKESNECWATDAIRHGGKYYFYFSRGRDEIGVVVGDSPAGPWIDPLGKPLIARGLTPTAARDPGILQEPDGTTYIIFGCWDYYIAKLNDDMISLSEVPRKIEVSPKMGPYGPGKLDDKPFLHERDGKYYLSWGCYYAMSDHIYGPYIYKDTIIHKERVEPPFQKGLTMDRHGSFFELYNQWYFICNDQSWPGTTAHFRDSVISYVHFRDNGEIEPVYLTRLGVSRYDAQSVIEAENYFRGDGVAQKESSDGGFEIRNIHNGTVLAYPNVINMPADATMSLRIANGNADDNTIEVRSTSSKGPLLGQCVVHSTGAWNNYQTISFSMKNQPGTHSLYLVFHGNNNDLAHLNWFSFK